MQKLKEAWLATKATRILLSILDLIYYKGEDTIVLKTLTGINSIQMLTKPFSENIATHQELDVKLQNLIAKENTSLDLHKLTLDSHSIYCNVKSNLIKPYISQSLRRIAFNIIHGITHPSVKTTKELWRRYAWPGINKCYYLDLRMYFISKANIIIFLLFTF